MLDHRVTVVVALGPCAAASAVMRVTVQMAAKLRARVRPELAERSFFRSSSIARSASTATERASGPGSDGCGVACGGHDRGTCPPQIYAEWCPRECAPQRRHVELLHDRRRQHELLQLLVDLPRHAVHVERRRQAPEREQHLELRDVHRDVREFGQRRDEVPRAVEERERLRRRVRLRRELVDVLVRVIQLGAAHEAVVPLHAPRRLLVGQRRRHLAALDERPVLHAVLRQLVEEEGRVVEPPRHDGVRRQLLHLHTTNGRCPAAQSKRVLLRQPRAAATQQPRNKRRRVLRGYPLFGGYRQPPVNLGQQRCLQAVQLRLLHPAHCRHVVVADEVVEVCFCPNHDAR
mmetsp:Transcript_44338/g.136836  ORF Transcript_44338/g.136836 Transcript_44338/m.136836 type:complete len:347 (+) Transcript_44338:710-1750(+)